MEPQYKYRPYGFGENAKKDNYVDRVHEHLKQYRSITRKKLFALVSSSASLPTVINRLRERGMELDLQMTKTRKITKWTVK